MARVTILGPLALAALAASACSCSFGPTRLGTLGPGTGTVGVKRLTPDAQATVCRWRVLGIPIGRHHGDAIEEALTHLLESDTEADLVTDAELERSHVVTGLVNRECVTLRGVLAVAIRTITLPAGSHEHGMH